MLMKAREVRSAAVRDIRGEQASSVISSQLLVISPVDSKTRVDPTTGTLDGKSLYKITESVKEESGGLVLLKKFPLDAEVLVYRKPL